MESELVVENARGRTSVLAIGVSRAIHDALTSLPDVVDVLEVDSLPEANARLLGPQQAFVLVDAHAIGESVAALDALRSRLSKGATLVITGGEDAFDLIASLREGFAFRLLTDETSAEELDDNLFRLIQPRMRERHALGAGWQIEGSHEGRLFNHRAGDLSNTGVSFFMRAGDDFDGFHPGRRITNLVLRSPDGQAQLALEGAVVRHGRAQTTSEGASIRVGLSFERPAPPPTLAVAADRSSTTALVRKALRAGGRFSIRRPGEETSVTYTTAELSSAPPQLVLLGATPRTVAPHDVFRLSFDLHGTSLSGLTSVIEAKPTRLVIALPTRLREQHRRHASRHPPETPWFATLTNTALGVTVRRQVLELHSGGLAVTADHGDLLPPGLLLDLVLELPEGRPSVHGQAIVRSLMTGPTSPEGSLRCGLALQNLSAIDAERLSRALIPVGFPGIEAATPHDFHTIWSFLPEAGLSYHLYADRSALSEQTIEETFGRVLGAGNEVAINLIERKNGRVRGHIAGVRLGKRTWLATHLAANTGEFRHEAQVSRALCLALLEHFEGKADFEYIKFFWKKALRWPNRVFGWAARGVAHTGLAELREQDLLVRELTGQPPPLPEGIDVAESTPDDDAWLEDFFLGHSGVLRVLADDLTRKGFRLSGVEKAYAHAGLSRTRLVRVARKGGERVGVSLLELSTQGLQLNEFTSHFEIFASEPGDGSLDVRRALVADAIRVYQNAGRRHAVALCEDLDTSPFIEAGFLSQTPFRSLTLHRSLIRSYSDLLALLFQKRGFEDVSDS